MEKQIPLKDILRNSRTQHRQKENLGHIVRIGEAIKNAEIIAPIEVVEIETMEGVRYIIIDGHHRVDAANRVGCKFIQAIIMNQGREGSIELAIELSLSANWKNGNALPREYVDIYKAAQTAAEFFHEQRIKKPGTSEFSLVDMEEIKEAVKCTQKLAEKVAQDFNRGILKKRKRSILISYREGVGTANNAKKHNVSVDTIRRIVKEYEDVHSKEFINFSGQQKLVFNELDSIDYYIEGKFKPKSYSQKQEDALSEEQIKSAKKELSETVKSHNLLGNESGDYKPRARYKHPASEHDLIVEEDLRMYLIQKGFHGEATTKEVGCPAGRVDIMTPTEIVEIKRVLNRNNIWSAVGQIHIYSQFFEGKKLSIAGLQHQDVDKLGQFVLAMGIDIITISPVTGDIKRQLGIANGPRNVDHH